LTVSGSRTLLGWQGEELTVNTACSTRNLYSNKSTTAYCVSLQSNEFTQ